MNERQINALHNLARTLADLASEERQRRYKAQVPFVHIPIELMAQCDAHESYLEKEWFLEWFDDDEVDALRLLFVAVDTYYFARCERCLDVDTGVLDDPAWRAVMAQSAQLLERLVGGGTLPLPPP